MSETPNQLGRYIQKAQKQTEKFLHDLNDLKRETVEELNRIKEIISPIISGKQYPKILQFKVGEDEYISVRRVEGNSLKTKFEAGSNGDIFNTKMFTFIPARFLPEDGMIGLIGISQTFNAQPKNEEDRKFVEEESKNMDSQGAWADFAKLQIFLYAGGEYKKGGWDFNESPVSVMAVKKVDGKFYWLNNSNLAQELEVNTAGDLEIPHEGYYWCDEELEIQKELNEKFSIFYAVIKGSSQKEEKESKSPVKQQSTIPVEIS